MQGIVLVTFPAASSIFTAHSGYGLTATQYGQMFVPQVIAAIVAALFGGRLGSRFGMKRVYLAGLIAALLSMLMLFVSQLAEADSALAYPLLLVATGFLGAGFGLTVPTLNTFVGLFHRRAVDRSVLILNALLGLGTALAPLFVAVFVGLGFWWGLPLLSCVLIVVLFVTALRLPLQGSTGGPKRAAAGIPRRFWLYAAVALLYGVVETMSGNWAQLVVKSDFGATAIQASLSLTAFWSMVTLGRIGFAALQRVVPARWIYRILPLIVATAFAIVLLRSPRVAVAGNRAVWPGWVRMLRAAPLHGQLRRGTHPNVDDGGWRRDCVLPGWLRDRGVRCRPAADSGRLIRWALRTRGRRSRLHLYRDDRDFAAGTSRPAGMTNPGLPTSESVWISPDVNRVRPLAATDCSSAVDKAGLVLSKTI